MTDFPTGKIRGLIAEAVGPYVIPSTEDDAVDAALSVFRTLLVTPDVAKAILALMLASLTINPVEVDLERLSAKHSNRPNKAFMVKAYGVVGASISAVLHQAQQRAEGTNDA